MFEISVNTRKAVVTNKEILTSGSAGIEVQFTLSEDWDALQKLAVFRVGDDGTKVDVALGQDLTCVVPSEVLKTEGEALFIGIYGANGAGSVIIPTVWASAGVVKSGTDPNTPAEAEPTPEIWAQILEVATDAEEVAGDALSIAESVEARADRGEFNGRNGTDGQDGYSPSASVAKNGSEATITITDKDGTSSVTISDGQDGADGEDGAPGVIQSVNGKSAADITIDAGDLEYDDTETYDSGTVGAELSDLKTEISAKQDAPSQAGTAGQVLGLDNSLHPVWVNQSGGGGGAVDSVNGKTGVVVLDAEDVGAYEKPSTGIPATDLASAVQTSLVKADDAIPAPSSPATGAFLVWNGSAWVAQTVPSANGVNF